jgi:hypothetical protein
MGLAVLKCDSNNGSSLLHYVEPSCVRDSELECVLEKGSYLVVPRTFGTSLKNL